MAACDVKVPDCTRPFLVSWGPTLSIAGIILVTVVSILKSPVVPINDPALYELYGLRILRGQHLYTQLPEVKFPSIYYVNALWQLLFGQHYRLHIYAEALVNLCSILFFALILRRNSVTSWAIWAFVFALLYCLPFPQFDYPQHYAVLFTLLAVYFSYRRWLVAAGSALAIATSFWLPAVLLYVPVLLRELEWSRRILLAAGALCPPIALYVIFVPSLGVGWPWIVVATWPQYFHAFGIDFRELWITISQSTLGPVIAMLVALFAGVAAKPKTDIQYFSLRWITCAAVGTCVPPKWSEHYFLPSVPALCCAISAYGSVPKSGKRRVLTGGIAGLFAAWATVNAWTSLPNFRMYSVYVRALGTFVIRNTGTGHVLATDEYIPELYLAADSVEPYPGAIGGQGNGYGTSQNNAAFLVSRNAWVRVPEFVAYGPTLHMPVLPRNVTIFNTVSQRQVTYQLVCADRPLGPIYLFASSEIASKFRCGD